MGALCFSKKLKYLGKTDKKLGNPKMSLPFGGFPIDTVGAIP